MPTADLFAEMRGRQEILRASKEAMHSSVPRSSASLRNCRIASQQWAVPFGRPCERRETPWDAEACSSISRTAAVTGGFRRGFTDLKCLACSSWSRTSDTPRYRILIPTSQFIPLRIHTLILHTIVDLLEAAGWGDALADGRKHGVDIGKLHEAAMFYLPSKRPDCFLVNFREGRKPLDPREWIKRVPDDLLASPPPPFPPEIQHHGDSLRTGINRCRGRLNIG